MTRRPGLALEVLVLLAFFAVTLANPGTFLQDPGTGWHIATGRWIAGHQALPEVDPFSFSAAPPGPILHYEWLFQLIAAGLVAAGGLPLLAAASALVHGLMLVHLHRRMIQAGADALTALALLLVSFLAFDMHTHARPHLFSYLLFSLVAGRLDAFARDPGRAHTLWLLPVIILPWCNLHAGFLAALILLGLHFVASLAAAVHSPSPARTRRCKTLAGVLAACLAAGSVNPHGPSLYPKLLSGIQAKAMTLWHEGASPDFNSGIPGLLLFEGIVLILVALLAAPRVRLRPLHALVILTFLHFSLHSARHILFFLLVALPPLGALLTAFLREHAPRLFSPLARITSDQAALQGRRWQVATAFGLFLAASLIHPPAAARTLVGPHLGFGAADFLRTNLAAFSRPFNTFDAGGTLIYEFWPALRVFSDDRAYLYGDDFILHTYLPVDRGDDGWQGILDRYAVNSAILPAGSPLASVLSREPGWQSVYQDSTNRLFVRSASAPP